MNEKLLDELYAIEAILQDLYNELHRLQQLQNTIRSGQKQLEQYSMQLTLRDLPPPWTGHGWALFGMLWVLMLDIWAGGLFGGLLFALFTWLRIKKQRSTVGKLMLVFFAGVMALIVSMLVLGKLLERGLSTPFVLAVASYLLGAALMIPVKKKANQQIDEENQRRADSNEALKQRNAKIRQQCNGIQQKINALQTELENAIRTFGYPPDYASLDAVQYFISFVENHRGDTYGEMIREYKAEQSQARMEAEMRKQTALSQERIYQQEYMNQQLRHANMLHAAQLSVQADIADQLRNSTYYIIT